MDIDQLPIEILVEIFLSVPDYVIPTYPAWDVSSSWWTGNRFPKTSGLDQRHVYTAFQKHHVFGDVYTAPWSLTAVCRKWREVAVGTPHLWTHIEFSFFGLSIFGNVRKLTNRLRLALKRSEPLHLSVTLSGDAQSDFAELQAILFKSAHRWEKLTIPKPFKDFWSFGEENLRKYSIYLDGDQWQGGHDDCPLSNLRTLVGCGDDVPYLMPRLRIWYALDSGCSLFYGRPYGELSPNLTHFSGHVSKRFLLSTLDSLAQDLPILSQLTNLTTLRLSVDFMLDSEAQATYDANPINISLSKTLSSLYLEFVAPYAERILLGMLTGAPALKTLSIASLHDATALIAFLTRSGCPLSSLSIHDAGLTNLDLVEILDGTPHLNMIDVVFEDYLDYVPQPPPEVGMGFVSNALLLRLLTQVQQVSVSNVHNFNPTTFLQFLKDLVHGPGRGQVKSKQLKLTSSSYHDELVSLEYMQEIADIGKALGIKMDVEGGSPVQIYVSPTLL